MSELKGIFSGMQTYTPGTAGGGSTYINKPGNYLLRFDAVKIFRNRKGLLKLAVKGTVVSAHSTGEETHGVGEEVAHLIALQGNEYAHKNVGNLFVDGLGVEEAIGDHGFDAEVIQKYVDYQPNKDAVEVPAEVSLAGVCMKVAAKRSQPSEKERALAAAEGREPRGFVNVYYNGAIGTEEAKAAIDGDVFNRFFPEGVVNEGE